MGYAEYAFSDSIIFQLRIIDVCLEAVQRFFCNDVLEAFADFEVGVVFIHKVENENVSTVFMRQTPCVCEILRVFPCRNFPRFFDDRT